MPLLMKLLKRLVPPIAALLFSQEDIGTVASRDPATQRYLEALKESSLGKSPVPHLP